MKETQIEVEGVKITLTTEQLRQIELQTKKKKPVTERIQSFLDVLDELGIDESDLPYKGLRSNLTPLQKQINATWRLTKIVKVYNEGIILDWKNSNQNKYTPYKYWTSGSWSVAFDPWSTDLHCSATLFYKSIEDTKDAYNKFKDIYEDYWNLS